MSYKMYIFPNRDNMNEGYDVSEIAHSIQYTTSLQGYPGKLTFVLEKDTEGILQLECGYAVAFTSNGFNVFFGYIFTIGTDRTEAYKVTAYDQMRYLQSHDYLLIESGTDTLDDVFKKVCSDFNLKFEIKNGDSTVKLRPHAFVDVSCFDIIQHAIDEVAIGGYKKDGNGNFTNEAAIESTLSEIGDTSDAQKLINRSFKAPYHFIRDRFGKLELNEIRSNADIVNLPIIGDGSLLTDYQYEISIDKDTYNRIEFVENLQKKNGQEMDFKGHVEDKETQKKWGTLKKVVTVRNSSNVEMFKKYQQLALESSNRVSKSINMKALGIDNLYAGDCFVLDLKKLNFKEVMYITAATHNYEADMHTMSLEVNQSPNLVERLGKYE